MVKVIYIEFLSTARTNPKLARFKPRQQLHVVIHQRIRLMQTTALITK